MRAARIDQDAGGSLWQPIAAANLALWGGLALGTAAIAVVLLPWQDALIAILALGPVLAIVRADLGARGVPDICVLVLAALGLDAAIANPQNGWLDGGAALLRAAVSVAVAMGVARLAGRIAGGRTSRAADDALGAGDLAVIGVAALWLPLSGFLLAVLMSSLAAMLVVARRSRRLDLAVHTEVPYAAFLVLAAYAVGLMTAVETSVGG